MGEPRGREELEDKSDLKPPCSEAKVTGTGRAISNTFSALVDSVALDKWLQVGVWRGGRAYSSISSWWPRRMVINQEGSGSWFASVYRWFFVWLVDWLVGFGSVWFGLVFETRSLVAQVDLNEPKDDLELLIHLLLPSKCQDYKHAPSHLALRYCGLSLGPCASWTNTLPRR